jgi:3'-phosphoadenosine 5'-phosphosulfate sulfotransferase (PAPS reductase)/FAD synthetase
MSEIKNHVVQFSGGRTSAYMVWLFEQRKKVEDINVEYIFSDTAFEHPKTYEFIRELVKKWNIDITCLRAVIHKEHGVGTTYKEISLDDCKQDLEPFKDMCEKYGTPYNPSGTFCTQFLKTIPAEKYCIDKFGKRNYIKWLGIRQDESSRIKDTELALEAAQDDMFPELKDNKLPPVYINYLARISDFDKQDILDWWDNQEFNLDLDSDILGNCVMCIKRPNNKLALSARYEPEMAKKFIQMVNLDSIPDKDREFPQDIMYRGGNSLESIINTFKDFSEDEIKRTMRHYKEPAATSCADSCEATVSNYDLFNI